jgi:dTDP-4-amino-4,6-dideoxygalactose transaminase
MPKLDGMNMSPPPRPSVPLLIPDMPSAEEVLPWLREIDGARWYTNGGPLAREFEARLLDVMLRKFPSSAEGGLHAAVVSSGTTALELALSAMGIGKGQRVLLPALTFPATATAVRRSGATPVLVDVDPESWSLTPEVALAALESTQADLVLPVAAFGCPQPVEAWDSFVQSTGIRVLIDAAAAFGDQAVGRHTVVTFSLHATKPLGVGEGGLVVASAPGLVDRVRHLANFGFHHGTVEVSGMNGKLSEYHAAVGLAQLARYGEVRSRRRRVWEYYRKELVGEPERVALQQVPWATLRSVMPVKVLSPGGAHPVARRLKEEGIETRRWYCPPLYAHPGFLGMERLGPGGDTRLPVTEVLAESILGLPFHSFLSEDDVVHVCRALRREAKPRPTWNPFGLYSGPAGVRVA